MSFELGLFEFLHGLTGKSSVLDFLFVLLARWLPYAMVLSAIFFLLTRKGAVGRVWGICVAGLTLILSRGILVEIISFLFVRARPNVVMGFDALIPAFTPAFPSGHASAFFALSAVVYFLDKRWGSWFWGLAALNAVSRVIVGVHWPTDILGGFVVAVFSFVLVRKLLKIYAPNAAIEPILSPPVLPGGEDKGVQ